VASGKGEAASKLYEAQGKQQAAASRMNKTIMLRDYGGKGQQRPIRSIMVTVVTSVVVVFVVVVRLSL
jgi:hypothetical protein